MREHLSIRLGDSVSKMRLDQAIAAQAGISRSLVAKLIKQGDLKINGRRPRKSDEVFAGDQVEILLPDTSEKSLETPAELPILYEDSDVVVVNKPAGMEGSYRCWRALGKGLPNLYLGTEGTLWGCASP